MTGAEDVMPGAGGAMTAPGAPMPGAGGAMTGERA